MFYPIDFNETGHFQPEFRLSSTPKRGTKQRRQQYAEQQQRQDEKEFQESLLRGYQDVTKTVKEVLNANYQGSVSADTQNFDFDFGAVSDFLRRLCVEGRIDEEDRVHIEDTLLEQKICTKDVLALCTQEQLLKFIGKLGNVLVIQEGIKRYRTVRKS